MNKLDENTKSYIAKHYPDLYRIYEAMQSMYELSDHGSIEIHVVKRRIKDKNGIYMKPGFTDEWARKSARIIDKKRGL